MRGVLGHWRAATFRQGRLLRVHLLPSCLCLAQFLMSIVCLAWSITQHAPRLSGGHRTRRLSLAAPPLPSPLSPPPPALPPASFPRWRRDHSAWRSPSSDGTAPPPPPSPPRLDRPDGGGGGGCRNRCRRDVPPTGGSASSMSDCSQYGRRPVSGLSEATAGEERQERDATRLVPRAQPWRVWVMDSLFWDGGGGSGGWVSGRAGLKRRPWRAPRCCTPQRCVRRLTAASAGCCWRRPHRSKSRGRKAASAAADGSQP